MPANRALQQSVTDRGGLSALLLAYVIWGVFPLYWRLLGTIHPAEQLWVRLILTAAVCIAILPMRGTWNQFSAAWRDYRVLGNCAFAGALLAINWVAFIYTVVNGSVMESSMGYFLCPLISLVFARVIEREKLDYWQMLAVTLAVAGTALMLWRSEQIPWAALIIAFTWAAYGLLKKRQPLGPVVSLGLECSLLSPFALLALILTAAYSSPTLIESSPSILLILSLSGAITAAPLILFAFAAPKVPMGLIGMGQYIVPSCHFMLALAFGESLDPLRMVSFALVWVALLTFSIRVKVT